MSIQIVEIAQPSVIDTVAVAQPSTVDVVEVRQGPAGPAGSAGPNVVNASTTSDGTADLSLAAATVSGTLTASHIHGNLAGSVYAHVRAGEALLKGDPVYVSGFHNGTSTAIVSKADASNAAKMPAIGIMDANLAHNATGHMVITGTITDVNTAGYAINAELYVAAGGGMTATPPTARAQPVARVERSNANNGAIIVKVNELSASDPTASTLARRDSAGGCQFTDLSASVSFDAGTFSVDSLTGSTFEAGSSVTFNATAYTYGTGAASAHRGALGLATTESVTFGNGTFAAGSIATSQPLTLTQTWATAAATYTGMRVNVTDSGPSSAASLLMDLQVGGTSEFKVSKGGSIFSRAAIGTNSGSPGADGLSLELLFAGYGIGTNANGDAVFYQNNTARTRVGFGVAIASNQSLGFTNATHVGGDASVDTIILRDAAANTLAQRNGTNAQVTRIYDTYTSATDYHRLAIATARATATAMSGASVTLTNIIPAGAVVVGVTCKVTTAITGATSFQLGTAADPDRFGAAIAITLGATSDNRDWTSGTIECFLPATSLVLTANGSNFTGGAVYVSVQYLSGQAD